MSRLFPKLFSLVNITVGPQLTTWMSDDVQRIATRFLVRANKNITQYTTTLYRKSLSNWDQKGR